MLAPRPLLRNARLTFAAAGDACIAVLSLVAAVQLRRHVAIPFTVSLLPAEKFLLSPHNAALFAGSFLLALAAAGFYEQRTAHRSRPAIAIVAAIQISLLAVVWVFRVEGLPRTVVLGTVVLEMPPLLLWRKFLAGVHGGPGARVVLVGSAPALREFFSNVAPAQMPAPVEALVSPLPPGVEGVPYWGSLDTPGVMEKVIAADEVVLVSDQEASSQRLRLLEKRGPRGFLLLPSASDVLALSTEFTWLGDQPLVEVSVPFGFGIAAVVKRATDVVLSLALLLVLSPLWLCAALVVAVGSGRPVLLRQPRVGRGGKTYGMWKFRTMKHEPNGDASAHRLVIDGDERVTGVGWLIRRYRLDEIPQLVNVIRGEMSLVGPRPEQPAVVESIVRDLPEFALRTMVRPGITGLAQVSANYETGASVKLRYDLAYMRDWSPWLDLRILGQTVAVVLSGRGL